MNNHYSLPYPFKQLGVRARLWTIITWILCLGSIIASAYWQFNATADQRVIIGDITDGSYVQQFYERERTFPSNLPFRWTKPESSSLRFWPLPAGSLAILHLDMYRDTEAILTISKGYDVYHQILISPEQRTYRILIKNLDQPIQLSVSPPLLIPSETRSLGVVLFYAGLQRTSLSTFFDILATFWLAPCLPLALTSLGFAHWLVGLRRYPSPLIPLTFATVLIGSALYPALKIELAWWVTHVDFIFIVSALALYIGRKWLTPIFDSDRFVISLLLSIGAITILFTFIPYIKGDGIGYYAYARALVYKGNLSMAETFMTFFSKVPYFHTETGIVYNPWSIGPALFWIGPLALHRLLFGGDGHDQGAIATAMLMSALFGFGTTIIAYYCARRWFSRLASALGALGAFFGSTLWFYSMQLGSFAHALSAFTCALGVLSGLRLTERPSLLRWITFGAAVGLMAVTYWATLILVIAPASAVLLMLWQARTSPARLRSLLIGSLAAATSAILVFSPQMIVWHLIYGTPFAKPPSTPDIVWHKLHLLELLFARFGLLFWSPAAMIGLVGIWLLPQQSPWFGSALLVAAMLYLLFNAILSDWHGSGAFGTRRLTSLAVWFALGLAALVEMLIARRQLFIALFGIGTACSWMFALIMRQVLGYFPLGTSHAVLSEMSFPDLYVVYQTWPTLEIINFFRNSFFWDAFTSPISIVGILHLLFVGLITIGVGWLFWKGPFSPVIMIDEQCKKPQ